MLAGTPALVNLNTKHIKGAQAELGHRRNAIADLGCLGCYGLLGHRGPEHADHRLDQRGSLLST